MVLAPPPPDGGRTAASTAAPMVKVIIARTAPLLGVQPYFGSKDALYSIESF
ncbi:hypothetical protein [Rhizobium leguminosarum]|uniref:hypothetical protein n=1 Tax=Rhizobium leguminosarum TaxID=384 RepID=UPI0013DD0D03|nr:hypothetical protein [Rhizobium leguminosarum]NEK34258.1 hypothetical protein [Rhizobium leguminosarum]